MDLFDVDGHFVSSIAAGGCDENVDEFLNTKTKYQFVEESTNCKDIWREGTT